MSNLSVITGASGHVGFALLKELTANHENIRILIRKDIPVFDNIKCDKVFGDITNPVLLERAFKDADIVYHSAGMIDVNTGNDDLVYKINVEGTKNVIDACKKCGVRRLVYVSSVDAFPHMSGNGPIHERDYFSKYTVEGTYAKSKAIATQYVLDSADENLEVVIVHPSACIGPYDYKNSNIGEMVRMFMSGLFPVTLDFGAYDFVDVRDVAKGIYLAAQKAKSDECFILSGEVVTLDEFITILSEICGIRKPKFVLKEWMAFTIAPAAEVYYKITKTTPLFTRYSIRTLKHKCDFSHEKAQKELGYNPIGTKETLSDMIDWISENEPKYKLLMKAARIIKS